MTRLLSGVALAAAAFAAIWFLPLVGLRVLACIIAALAARDYLALVHPERRPPQPVPVMLLVVLTCWWMSDPGRMSILSLLLLAIAWLSIEVIFRGFAVDRAAARCLALWYIGMPLGMLVAVQAIGGALATLLLVATVVVSDSAQYYAGRLLGRRPLAPAISPKKTIEGALGGLAAAAIFMAASGRSVLPAAGWLSLALLGVVIAALGICGDLFESRLKRTAGVKDSAALVPGHGGVLDRIDALLFSTPAFYLYVLS
jgi:phosphatidate cytidylyltransferase